MVAAVRLCGSVLVALVSSFAVAPLLCWWGSWRATALVKWCPSGRGKAPTAADGERRCCRRSDEVASLLPQPTEIDEAAPSLFFFLPSFQSIAVTRHTHRAAAARPPFGRLLANRTVQLMWTLLSRVFVMPSCFLIHFLVQCRARMVPLFVVQCQPT
ncbi:retrotransposon hot spot (RHS) protein [Trypanosoma cruzi]|nr:retrotransposon hot spot (RHS) protein [Trypanosoma cruzi]